MVRPLRDQSYSSACTLRATQNIIFVTIASAETSIHARTTKTARTRNMIPIWLAYGNTVNAAMISTAGQMVQGCLTLVLLLNSESSEKPSNSTLAVLVLGRQQKTQAFMWLKGYSSVDSIFVVSILRRYMRFSGAWPDSRL